MVLPSATSLTAYAALLAAFGALVTPWITARFKSGEAAELNFNEQFKLLAKELRQTIADNEERCNKQLREMKRQATDAQLRLLKRIRRLERAILDMGGTPPADDEPEMNGKEPS